MSSPTRALRPPPSGALEGGSQASFLLTADQLAERWQVPKAHVYRLAREGRLPTVELGRYRRFRFEAIAAFEADGGTATE